MGPKEGCNFFFFFWNTIFFLLPETHRDNYTIGKLDPRGKFKEAGTACTRGGEGECRFAGLSSCSAFPVGPERRGRAAQASPERCRVDLARAGDQQLSGML